MIPPANSLRNTQVSRALRLGAGIIGITQTPRLILMNRAPAALSRSLTQPPANQQQIGELLLSGVH